MDSTTSLSVATQASQTQVPTKAPVEPPPPPIKAEADTKPVQPAGPKDNGKELDVQT
jgi:hypothetical protein